ncbi:hypothetical protein [Streptomyces sp. 2P-4]|nr:hypothetical protein [Streptomyces sp. 2P-4]
MEATTALVCVLLGGCVVAIVTVVAKAYVDVARIQAGTPPEGKRR